MWFGNLEVHYIASLFRMGSRHYLNLATAFLLMTLALGATGVHAARVLDKSLGWPGSDLNGVPCGGKGVGFGPYDYTDPRFIDQLHNVEGHHFSQGVEQLKKGVSSTVSDDLDYTLRAFPNHHRALYAMLRYQQLNKRPLDAEYAAAECYLQRAIEFAPEDAVLPLLYGILLHKRGFLEQALEQYRKAEALKLDSAELHYNMGLVLTELKRFPEANEQAQLAYRQGYPLPALRDTLKRLGYWESRQPSDSP